MTTFTTQDRQDAQREPIAWIGKDRETGIAYLQFAKPTRMDKVGREYIPLYQTATPLTEEQIKELYIKAGDELFHNWKNSDSGIFQVEFARAIERAHGIGE